MDVDLAALQKAHQRIVDIHMRWNALAQRRSWCLVDLIRAREEGTWARHMLIQDQYAFDRIHKERPLVKTYDRTTLIKRLVDDYRNSVDNEGSHVVDYILHHGFKGFNHYTDAELIKAAEDADLIYDDEEPSADLNPES